MGSSMEEADETINLCARCREAATLLCYGCYKTPGSGEEHADSVWFCSTKCQKIDWKFHKYDCRKAQARRSLHRVADTAKLAYFHLVQRNYDVHIVRVEDKGKTLYVQEGPKDQSKVNQLPVQHLDINQDQQAVMARMNCGSSENYVHVLVETMLQGIPFKVAEVHILEVKYQRRVMVIESDSHKSDSSKPEHVIFKITINEDEDYALDITGSQFGFYDALTPWASYQRNRIETLGRILPLSRLRDSQRQSSKNFGQKNRDSTTAKGLNHQSAQAFDSALKSWEENNGKFTAMLKLREDVFRKKRGELLDYIDKHVSSRKKQLQEAKDPKKKALQVSQI